MRLFLCFKRVILILLLLNLVSNLTAQKSKNGIALSGGGALGFAHIGILKVLEENNIPIGVISGTSMGSVIGSFYSLGFSAKEIEQIVLKERDFFKAINDQNDRMYQTMGDKLYTENEVFNLFLRQTVDKDGKTKYKSSIAGGGIIKGNRLDGELDDLLFDAGKYATFKDLPRSFAPVAFDLDKRESVALTQGSLSQAVRASFALPALLSPVVIDGRTYFDGFIARKFPTIDAINMGANRVILVTLTSEKDRKKTISSDSKTVTFADWVEFFVTRNSKQFEEQKKLADVIIDVDFPAKYTFYSYSKIKEIIKLGEDAARAMLPQLQSYVEAGYQAPTKERFKSYNIENIEIRGTANQELAHSILNLKPSATMKIKDITRAVKTLAYSDYFLSARFWLKETTLIINVEERYPLNVSFGLGYNSDYGLNGGASFSARNINKVPVVFKSKLTYSNGIDFGGHLRIASNKAPNVNVFTSWQVSETLYERKDQDGNFFAPARRDVNTYSGDIGLLFYITSYLSVSTAYRLENWNNRYVNNDFYGSSYDSGLLSIWMTSFNADMQNSKYYPTKGLKFSINNYLGADHFSPTTGMFYRLDGMASYAVELGAGFSIEGATYGGFITGEDKSKPYYMEIGGIQDKGRRIGMLGYSLASDDSYGESAWILRGMLRYSFFEKFHISTSWQGGWLSDSQVVSLRMDDFVQSLGGNFGIDFKLFRFQWGLYWNFSDDRLYSTTTVALRY